MSGEAEEQGRDPSMRMLAEAIRHTSSKDVVSGTNGRNVEADDGYSTHSGSSYDGSSFDDLSGMSSDGREDSSRGLSQGSTQIVASSSAPPALSTSKPQPRAGSGSPPRETAEADEATAKEEEEVEEIVRSPTPVSGLGDDVTASTLAVSQPAEVAHESATQASADTVAEEDEEDGHVSAGEGHEEASAATGGSGRDDQPSENASSPSLHDDDASEDAAAEDVAAEAQVEVEEVGDDGPSKPLQAMREQVQQIRLRHRRHSTGSPMPKLQAVEGGTGDTFESFVSYVLSLEAPKTFTPEDVGPAWPRRASEVGAGGEPSAGAASPSPTKTSSPARGSPGSTSSQLTPKPSMSRSRSWSHSPKSPLLQQVSRFTRAGQRISARGINKVQRNDQRIIRTRTIMRNRPDTNRGAGVSVSTVKALVRHGDPSGEIYIVMMEAEPRAAVTVRMVASTIGDNVMIFPSRLTFDASNWSQPRLVKISAYSDVAAAMMMQEQKTFSEMRRVYNPVRRGKATILHISESKDQRYGGSLVIQPVKVMVARHQAGFVWAGGSANGGKLGLNVRSTACLDEPHMITYVPPAAMTERYVSRISLKTVPFKPISRPSAESPKAGGAKKPAQPPQISAAGTFTAEMKMLAGSQAWLSGAHEHEAMQVLDPTDDVDVDKVHPSARARHRRRMRQRKAAAVVEKRLAALDQRQRVHRRAQMKSRSVMAGGAKLSDGSSMRDMLDLVVVKPKSTVWQDAEEARKFHMTFEDFPYGWELSAEEIQRARQQGYSSEDTNSDGEGIQQGSRGSVVSLHKLKSRVGLAAHDSRRKESMRRLVMEQADGTEELDENTESAAMLSLRARAVGIMAGLVRKCATPNREETIPEHGEDTPKSSDVVAALIHKIKSRSPSTPHSATSPRGHRSRSNSGGTSPRNSPYNQTPRTTSSFFSRPGSARKGSTLRDAEGAQPMVHRYSVNEDQHNRRRRRRLAKKKKKHVVFGASSPNVMAHPGPDSSSSDSDSVATGYGSRRERVKRMSRVRRQSLMAAYLDSDNDTVAASEDSGGQSGDEEYTAHKEMATQIIDDLNKGTKASERWRELKVATTTAKPSSPKKAIKPTSIFEALMQGLEKDGGKKKKPKPPPLDRATIMADSEARLRQFPPLCALPEVRAGKMQPVPAVAVVSKDRAKAMLKFVRISTGHHHSAAISRQGSLFTWGSGEKGELGLGAPIGRHVPVMVRDLGRLVIASVGCGEEHTVASSSDGRAFTWGCNQYGQLGLGLDYTALVMAPKHVKALKGSLVSMVAAGSHHTAFVTAGMHVYTAGNNQGGQLGLGDRSCRSLATYVNALESCKVTSVACGAAHSACVTNAGKVYTWGYGADGRLGHGDSKDRLTPTVVQALDSRATTKWSFLLRDPVTRLSEAKRRLAKAVFCGGAHTAYLSIDHRLYTWGCNSFGQLGHGDTKSRSVPKEVDALVGISVSQVSLGQFHSAAVTYNGMLFTWGCGELGALLHKFDTVTQSLTKPKLVHSLVGLDVYSISCGDSHTMVLTEQHKVADSYRQKVLRRHLAEAAEDRELALKSHQKRRVAHKIRAGVRLRSRAAASEVSDLDNMADALVDDQGTATPRKQAQRFFPAQPSPLSKQARVAKEPELELELEPQSKPRPARRQRRRRVQSARPRRSPRPASGRARKSRSRPNSARDTPVKEGRRTKSFHIRQRDQFYSRALGMEIKVEEVEEPEGEVEAAASAAVTADNDQQQASAANKEEAKPSDGGTADVVDEAGPPSTARKGARPATAGAVTPRSPLRSPEAAKRPKSAAVRAAARVYRPLVSPRGDLALSAAASRSAPVPTSARLAAQGTKGGTGWREESVNSPAPPAERDAADEAVRSYTRKVWRRLSSRPGSALAQLKPQRVTAGTEPIDFGLGSVRSMVSASIYSRLVRPSIVPEAGNTKDGQVGDNAEHSVPTAPSAKRTRRRARFAGTRRRLKVAERKASKNVPSVAPSGNVLRYGPDTLGFQGAARGLNEFKALRESPLVRQ